MFKLGVPLAELWWLAELADWLAAHDRTACLLTAPPLYLPGAVGLPRHADCDRVTAVSDNGVLD